MVHVRWPSYTKWRKEDNEVGVRTGAMQVRFREMDLQHVLHVDPPLKVSWPRLPSPWAWYLEREELVTASSSDALIRLFMAHAVASNSICNCWRTQQK